ncbi:MAG: hypothetical protein IK062_00595 [Selenomonadaceae bacterium]|nr:hypothetical protein [Selenomonadaceae bacterium]
MTTATTTEIKAKAESKTPSTEVKNEVKTESKLEVKAEKKSEVKTESKSAVKTENKITVTPEVKVDKKTEVNTDNKPEVKVEEQKPTAKNPPKESKIKPQSAGAKIRAMFEKILNDGKVTADVMKILTNVEETKKVLSIRYAFLKPVTKNPNDRKINGHARYGTAIVEIKGEKFWLTNDLYAKQVEIFEKWTKSLYAEKKSEVKK